jgi:Fe-Mn family superoxide dismutase
MAFSLPPLPYIDFRNARPKYIETFLTNLANWDFAGENLRRG